MAHKEAWYNRILKEKRREIVVSACIVVVFALTVSLWRYFIGTSFEWQSIEPIDEYNSSTCARIFSASDLCIHPHIPKSNELPTLALSHTLPVAERGITTEAYANTFVRAISVTVFLERAGLVRIRELLQSIQE